MRSCSTGNCPKSNQVILSHAQQICSCTLMSITRLLAAMNLLRTISTLAWSTRAPISSALVPMDAPPALYMYTRHLNFCSLLPPPSTAYELLWCIARSCSTCPFCASLCVYRRWYEVVLYNLLFCMPGLSIGLVLLNVQMTFKLLLHHT